MYRHLDSRPTIPDALHVWNARPQNPRCLAPRVPHGCSGDVINSHVVQRRGGGLQNIARAGKVYGFKHHPMFFIKQNGWHEPALVGIHAEVGVPLFCARHDQELFREAETQPFEPTSRQLVQLNYRTVASRLYSNEAVVPQFPQLYDADRGLPRDDQRRIFIAVDKLREESETYLANIRALKAQYDDWMSGDAVQTNALVLWFDGSPEFMCASLTYALMDFQGLPIAPVGGLAHLCYYTVSDGATTAVVFSWLGQNTAAERLCTSLLLLPPESRAFATLRYALEYIDLIYLAPDWWDRLPATGKAMIVELLTEHSKPFRTHASNALVQHQSDVSRLSFRKHTIIGGWRPA